MSCLPVRVEAVQSLFWLGPPWEKREPLPGGGLSPPKVDAKAAEPHIAAVKKRIGLGKAKAPETERQVDIWGRLVLMVFDPKEVNDANLDAIARHLTSSDLGPKLQALQAFALLGEKGAKKMDVIIQALDDKDPGVVARAATALVAMGPEAKKALPAIEKLKARGSGKEQEYYRKLAEEAIKLINKPAVVAAPAPPAKKP